jgi:hypothetical protein
MRDALSRCNPTRGRVFPPTQAIFPPGPSKNSYNSALEALLYLSIITDYL